MNHGVKVVGPTGSRGTVIAVRYRRILGHCPGNVVQPLPWYDPGYQDISLETYFPVAQHCSHLADLLILLHGLHPLQEKILGDAYAFSHFLVWLCH